MLANHATEKDVWLGFYKKGTGLPGLTMEEANVEAMCFGWIDAIRKSIDESSYAIRYMPRRKKGTWSKGNVELAQELIDLGLMQPSGLEVFESRNRSKTYSYAELPKELSESYKQQFREQPGAWNFFEQQPRGYQRRTSFWVMYAKREETRQKRLTQLIEASASGNRLNM